MSSTFASYADRRFDVVVLGATGFTVSPSSSVSSALPSSGGGGGDPSLTALLLLLPPGIRDMFGTEGGVAVIRADVTDQQSLMQMASQTRLLLSCVGPYRLFGEAVVEACVACATDYIDVSGEPQFIEKIQMKYHEEAQRNSCVVVSACGFDSIPADLGTLFAMQQIKSKGAEVVHSVESFVEFRSKPGVTLHFATYESAVYGLGSVEELRSIRKQIRSTQTNRIEHVGSKLKRSALPTFNNQLNRWVLPFPGSDASVVRRSLQARADAGESPLPYYDANFTLKSTLNLILFVFFGTLFGSLAKFRLGRKLLLTFPLLFSCGLVSHTGPTQEHLEAGSFSMRFFATGYKDLSRAAFSPPDIRLEASVSGPEPGYIATPIMAVQSALTVLDNKRSIGSGVLTSAQAFGGTDLIARLHQEGIKFEVVDSEQREN